MLFAVDEYVTADEIKRLRKKLGITQSEFAQLIRTSKPTVERWERSRDNITGPIVLLVKMLNDNIDYANNLVVPERQMPIRMWYMYKQKICTLIDVDDVKRIVKIKNYNSNILFTAFGVNQNPSYDDYMELLESRCFPRTRDKMKLILNELNIPFYDPYMIVEKTQGRMAEDDFWIKIEKNNQGE